MVPRNFNPRTPVGCDARFQAPELPGRYFNPRTPVGCDLLVFRRAFRQAISIHAPQWGATSLFTHECFRIKDFNPRTPVGCDHYLDCAKYETRYFNPRTPVGCDVPRRGRPRATHPFQSTHPSGVRPCRSTASRSMAPHFNPRTPVGCDAVPGSSWSRPIPFQSTHPSGVRR